MPKVTLNQLRERAERVEQRRREYRERAVAGTLVRHETWRLDYLSRPYLLGAPDERVAERFRNVEARLQDMPRLIEEHRKTVQARKPPPGVETLLKRLVRRRK